MRKRLTCVFCISAFLLAIGLAALGVEADFNPSSYNPALGEAVAFEVCQPCVSSEISQYEWDFDGDGLYEVSTEEPLVVHTFTEPGYVDVELRVVDAGGRAVTRTKGILVGESPLFAVRNLLTEENGGTFVLVTLTARAVVSAPALEETLPRGWQVEILNSEGAFTKVADGTLQALWAEMLIGGETRTFSYRLY
ncbi:PKD domain-containing protein, partial [Candidatus Bipolaricaulota bacterium]|nr:PKD domain-containing protein [Candidatus Bipolaricaulota bacterium]